MATVSNEVKAVLFYKRGRRTLPQSPGQRLIKTAAFKCHEVHFGAPKGPPIRTWSRSSVVDRQFRLQINTGAIACHHKLAIRLVNVVCHDLSLPPPCAQGRGRSWPARTFAVRNEKASVNHDVRDAKNGNLRDSADAPVESSNEPIITSTVRTDRCGPRAAETNSPVLITRCIGSCIIPSSETMRVPGAAVEHGIPVDGLNQSPDPVGGYRQRPESRTLYLTRNRKPG
jgi:hypothetical protein